jgi:lipoprotein-anchoring transpeptidase ErfK/SrfK
VKKSARSIHVSVARQRLAVKRGGEVERTFPISTSKFGLGMQEGSFKTPTGRFRIADKIGAGEPLTTAFRARVPFEPTAADLEGDDLVMTRILWLDGLDAGNANTHSRYIYIHGTNHEELIGTPASHGCIRMRNADVAELFDLVEVGTPLVITPPRPRKRTARKAKKTLRTQTAPPK